MKCVLQTLAAAVLAAAVSTKGEEPSPADDVNPLMGTANTLEVSCGNLYPAICRPWGMNCWTPQTGAMGNGWIYDYAHRKIRGIRQTHQPSPWIGDYGQFAVLPITGRAVFREEERASWFSHKAEDARPYRYRVYLADHDVTVEVAPTARAAMLRATYPATDSAQFVVDCFDEGAWIRIEPDRRRVVGRSTKRNVRGNEKSDPPRALANWFVMEFDHPFAAAQVWADGHFEKAVLEKSCAHAGALLRFAPTRRGERVQVRVASSFVDLAQAERNLAELGSDDFDVVAEKGRAEWNAWLGRIRVAGGDATRRRTFHTCLYRALLFPRRFFELDADGHPVHRSPSTGEVRPGVYFCDTGFWDTFRSLFPLLNFVYPEMNAQMTKGLEACLDEGGWLPEWSSPGYRHCMIGQNSASVVADAVLSGVARDCDAQKLLGGLYRSANGVKPENVHVGRLGFAEYNALGYVPRDIGIRENAARTLEYAYDDWCIARLARALGRPAEEVAVYARRSRNWRNLLHPVHRLMSGRNRDGSFDRSFDRFRWGGDFTEGNPLHYTWSVFHDIAGLMEAMGGRAAFARQLDEVFALPPVFDGSFYGGCTHEIREMQIVNFGQYAHGNQPIQHMIYLYDWCGEPWKTQHWVREACNRLYHPVPDGYCGDEDNGQTSAWYVWSSIGFYPVCPGSGEYALGAPQFPQVTVRLPENRTLEIRAEGVSDVRRYVERLTVDGVACDRNFLRFADLRKGGRLVFEMADRPNTARGVGPSAAPYSDSTAP